MPSRTHSRVGGPPPDGVSTDSEGREREGEMGRSKEEYGGLKMRMRREREKAEEAHVMNYDTTLTKLY